MGWLRVRDELKPRHVKLLGCGVAAGNARRKDRAAPVSRAAATSGCDDDELMLNVLRCHETY